MAPSHRAPLSNSTSIDPRPSNRAVTKPAGRSGTALVRPPDSTRLPGLSGSPRAARDLVSHATPAAGWPIATPAAAVAMTLDRARNTQPTRWRSAMSRGRTGRVPRATRAAPALSAIESGRRNDVLYRESVTSIAANTASVAPSTRATVTGPRAAPSSERRSPARPPGRSARRGEPIAVGDDHCRGQDTVYRLVDSEGAPLDLARHA